MVCPTISAHAQSIGDIRILLGHNPTIALPALASIVPNFPRCIGIVDDTLVKIHWPWKNLEYRKWFNGKKKMYRMNNVIIVNHHGLFIYVNTIFIKLGVC